MLARCLAATPRVRILALARPMAAFLSSEAAAPPRRPTPAYAMFVKDVYPEVKEEMGDDAVATDIFKQIGKEWKELDAEDLAEYEKRAAEDKARYEKEAAAFLAAGGDADALKRQKRPKRKVRDKTKPKRALTAWTFFVKDFIAERPEGQEVTAAMKEAPAAFAAISEAKKAELQAKADADAKRYHEEMIVWQAKQEAADEAGDRA